MKNTYICPSCKKEFDWDDSMEETLIRCPVCQTEMMAPSPILTKGAVVGDYLIRERIGIGGMGEVYLAEQRSMKRPIALKILHEDLIKDQAYLERFYREVRILAQIEHPNVVSAIEAGKDCDVYYFSMTYIDGKDIKRLLDEGVKFSEFEALRVCCEIAYALKYAWDKHGILHRDIKPANIMLTNEGDVKLMDLGISKKVKGGEDVELTMAGMMVGSPQYVSPEQAKALKDMDFRADMYSLGASLYHMLVGQTPFPGDNAMEVLARHLDEPVPDPRKIRKDISKNTAELISIMMAKRKEDRFASWDDCIQEIKDIMDDLSEGGKLVTSHIKTGKTRVGIAIGKVAVEKKKTGQPIMSAKMMKVVIYVLLFTICLAGFSLVIKKGMADAKKDRAKNLFNEAVKFIESNPDPSNFRKALVMFEAVQRVGDADCAAAAKGEMDKILDKVQKLKNKKIQDQKRTALEELKKQSFEYEKNGELDKALAVWTAYKSSGPYAKDFDFEISKAVDYLNRKKKVKEDGVD